MARNSSILPDDAVFADFRNQCLSSDNWQNKYDLRDMQVWIEVPQKGNQVQKIHKLKVSRGPSGRTTLEGEGGLCHDAAFLLPLLRVCFQCRMAIHDVAAETMYDVLHDSEYRKVWDDNMLASQDIARLSPNADVGYYACEDPPSRRPVGESGGKVSVVTPVGPAVFGSRVTAK